MFGDSVIRAVRRRHRFSRRSGDVPILNAAHADPSAGCTSWRLSAPANGTDAWPCMEPVGRRERWRVLNQRPTGDPAILLGTTIAVGGGYVVTATTHFVYRPAGIAAVALAAGWVRPRRRWCPMVSGPRSLWNRRDEPKDVVGKPSPRWPSNRWASRACCPGLRPVGRRHAPCAVMLTLIR